METSEIQDEIRETEEKLASLRARMDESGKPIRLRRHDGRTSWRLVRDNADGCNMVAFNEDSIEVWTKGTPNKTYGYYFEITNTCGTVVYSSKDAFGGSSMGAFLKLKFYKR